MKPGAGRARRRGFALLMVIWGIGVVSMLVLSFASTERKRLVGTVDLLRGDQATLLAQSAIDAGILSIIAEVTSQGQPGAGTFAGGGQRPVHDGAPRFCTMAEAAAAISIEDESGKVDLNAASEPLLTRLFLAFGLGQSDAGRLASAVITFRTAPTADIAIKDTETGGRPFSPKRNLFQSIYELDQVVGVEGALMQKLAGALTVHSQQPGVDPASAPPGLFAAMAGFPPVDVEALTARPWPNALDREDPRFPAEFKRAGESLVFTVHAEAALAGGQYAVREAIVDFRRSGQDGGVYAIHETRHGVPRFRETLTAAFQNGLPTLADCREAR